MKNDWHEFDPREAIAAIDLYVKATGKTKVDAMNRFCRNTAARAPRYISKTPLGKINKHDPDRSTKRSKAPRLLYALAAKDGHRRGEGIATEARRRFAQRRSSSGFAKALWFGPAQAFGARTRNRAIPGGSAARFSAKPATPGHDRAEFTTGPFDMMLAAILKAGHGKAAADATRDMNDYARKKMAETANKYSGR